MGESYSSKSTGGGFIQRMNKISAALALAQCLMGTSVYMGMKDDLKVSPG